MNNEDKKILEEYVQEFNENKKKYKLAYSTGFGKFWSNFVKAIENLINRNKQLEEIEKEHKKENGELREEVTHWKGKYHLENRRYLDLYDKKVSIPIINATEEMLQQYIEKSKILEILDKYKYTELGNDEEIINFYKELRRLIEERN